MKPKKNKATEFTTQRPKDKGKTTALSPKNLKNYFQVNDRVAYAHNNMLVFGFILRFEDAPDGPLVVVTQDQFLNHVGRPMYRRPDQILAVED